MRISDWSSDVCSSDLDLLAIGRDPFHFEKVTEPMIDRGAPGSIDETHAHKPSVIWHDGALYHFYAAVAGQYPDEVRGVAVARSVPRSEAGRVGKECVRTCTSRWSPYTSNKKHHDIYTILYKDQ